MNMELYGIIKQTHVNGIKIYSDGKFPNLNEGKLILEKEHV
jgi:hypothetical protein